MVELVRSWEYLGGPWGLLGASQWQVPPALRLASVGGVWLVSLLVVAVNTAVAELIARPAARLPAVAGLLVCALAGTVAWLWAPVPRITGSVRVAVVQPNRTGTPAARLDRSEALTRSLAGRGVRLIVWGESSLYTDPADHPALAARLAALSRQTGAELLINADSAHAGRPGISKSAVLIGPDGPTGDRYAKMRLVPFGEYIPFRSVLGWATRVGKAAPSDRLRGTGQVVMPVAAAGGLRIGPLVCFETAFPDMSRHLARDGARVLVAQSSTSTFQDSWAPAQHASLAALRAAETWRPMVHATLTGISAVYGPGVSRSANGSAPTAVRRPSTICPWPRAPARTPGSATGRCTGRWVRWCSPAGTQGCGRSAGGLSERVGDHPFAQLMGAQGVLGGRLPAGPYVVQESQDDLLDTALPGDRHPVAAAPDARLPLVVNDLGEIDDLALGVLTGNVQDFLRGSAQAVHGAESGETVARELQHHMLHQPLTDPGPHIDVVDLAGDEEPQGVHDMDEVVQHERARILGQPDPVLLHQDQIPGMLAALGVGGSETAVEAHGEAHTAVFGQRDKALGGGELVGERLVDVGRHPCLDQPVHDLGVGSGGGVHEGRVQAGGEQRVQVAVELAPVSR